MPELTEEQPLTVRERRLTNQLDTQTHVISDLIKHNHELSAALDDLHKTHAASSGEDALYADMAHALLDMLHDEHEEKTIYHAVIAFDYLIDYVTGKE